MADPQAITGFRYEISADGRFALVEFRALDMRAFTAIRQANRADVVVFPANATSKAEIEREFQKYKPGFSADLFLAGGTR